MARIFYSSANIALYLKRAFDYRRGLKLNTNAMRLVNGSGDGLEGLIVDRFDKHFVIYFSDERWHAYKEIISGILREQFEVKYLICKNRLVSGSASDIASDVLIGRDNSQTVVEENGLRFRVDLNDTLNSGLFLDMRHNRQIIAGLVKGKKVLNCFAYTCSFGVYCRSAGALGVANVDISLKSLARGRYNYELNHLVPAQDEFIRAPAVRYLQRAGVKNNFFDLIILDPPSFSRFEGKVFSVKKDMPALIEKAMRALTTEGALFISTNLSLISCLRLEAWARSAAKNSGRKVAGVKRLGQDIDFRASNSMKESSLSAVLLKLF